MCVSPPASLDNDPSPFSPPTRYQGHSGRPEASMCCWVTWGRGVCSTGRILPTSPRAGGASLRPGPSDRSEGNTAGMSVELVILSGGQLGQLGPLCHLDPSG